MLRRWLERGEKHRADKQHGESMPSIGMAIRAQACQATRTALRILATS